MSSCFVRFLLLFVKLSVKADQLSMSFAFILLHLTMKHTQSEKCEWNDLAFHHWRCVFRLISCSLSIKIHYLRSIFVPGSQAVYVCVRKSLSRSFQFRLKSLFLNLSLCLTQNCSLAGVASSAKQRHRRFSIFFIHFHYFNFLVTIQIWFYAVVCHTVILVAFHSQRWLPCI